MIILGLDFSYSKSGYSVSKIDLSNGNIKLIDCGLLISPKDLEFIERIDSHINDIYKVIRKYKPDLVVKEAAIMGRSSTGLNVIKSHGVLEYECFNNLTPLEEVHNQTIKAWARKQLIENNLYTKETIKSIDKKLVVAEAIESYYDRTIEEIRTPRGRLLDDVADGIAIPIVYYEKNLK